MSLRANLLSLAILASFTGTALADEQAVIIAQQVLQTTAAKTRGSGGDVILPNGWEDSSDGYQRVRFNREWNHLPVRGGDTVVTLDPNDQVVAITETFVPLTLSKNPKLKDKDAIVAAGADFGSGFTNKPTAQLVVFTYADGSAKLGYEVLLIDSIRSILYTVDANTGAFLGKWDWHVNPQNDVFQESEPDDRCIGPDPGNKDAGIDIWGHITGHWRRANFRPAGESGGLFEGGADIVGTIAERHASGLNDGSGTLVGNYLFGEHHPMFGANPGFTHALRYLFDPHRDGVSLNCYAPSIGAMEKTLAGSVAGRFFYLLAEGTGHKTFDGVDHYAPTCNGASFAGVGLNNAEMIWGTAEEGYMTSLTDYARARVATLQAAKELYGANSPEISAVANAWSAVGVQ